MEDNNINEIKKTVVPRTDKEIAQLTARLKKIEGQVRGIQKMVEDERYCIDILVQINAVNSALKKAGMNILKRHTEFCIKDSVEKNDPEASKESIDELMSIIELFSKI